VRHWGFIKKDISFATLTNDGDDEGCFMLHRLPTASEAEIIRERLSIRKRPSFDEATLERKRAAMAALNNREAA
jgi:hypothetical protein